MSTIDFLIVLVPVVLLQTGLMIFSLKDLAGRRNTRYLPRLAWVFIIIFINILGPICYLALGRTDYDSQNR